LIFTTLLDHDSQAGREIRDLLLDHRALVVELPENGRDNLSEIWLDTNTKSINNRAEAIEHDLIFRGLFLE